MGNIFGVGPGGGGRSLAPEATLLGRFDFGGNAGNVAWGRRLDPLLIAAQRRG